MFNRSKVGKYHVMVLRHHALHAGRLPAPSSPPSSEHLGIGIGDTTEVTHPAARRAAA